MNNSLIYSPHPVFPEVEMLKGQTVLHSYPRHFHDALGLAVIHSGVELCWSRGAEHVFQAGDVALFNAGDIHDGRPGDAAGWTYDMVYFPHDMVCHLLDQSQCWFDAVSIRDPHIASIAQVALRTSAQEDTMAAQESMIALLTALVFRSHVHAPDPMVALRVRDFIDAHADQAISAQQLATVSGLSMEHTIRSFRRSFGITPHAYHQARRSENARRLLRGRKALAEISYALGFYDQSHFNKWFRKTQGVTPLAYRTALGG